MLVKDISSGNWNNWGIFK